MSDASPVVVFYLWARRPVFHLDRPWLRGEMPRLLADGWKQTERRTLCGLVSYAIEWHDVPGGPSDVRREERAGTHLRRDHAEMFCRECQRCAHIAAGP